jgi:translation initiation factor IF-3
VLDYSKYKYEQAQRQKAARKHQQQITIREIKFRPKIAEHDYATKKGHVERFLKARDKVKVTIMFRGREVAHPERGEIILNRLAEELAEIGIVEQRPAQDGRNMTMILGPMREGAIPVPARKPGDDESATQSTEEQAALRRPVLREHAERPEEEAKEARREVPAREVPVAEVAPEGAAVQSAQPSDRAAKLAALRARRAAERGEAPPAAKPAAAKKPAAKKPAAKPKAKAKAKPKAKAPAK